MDYTSNAHKDKEKKERPEKNIERVVSGDVIVKKKSIGRKIKGLFVEADLKTVAQYVVSSVLIPAARNMIVDSATKGVERLMYGESATRRRGLNLGEGTRIQYNSPLNRGIGQSYPLRQAPAVSSSSRSRYVRDDLILPDRATAETVLERLNDIIDNYEFASVGDLNELVGLPSSHTDQKWGWIYVGDTQIHQVREGYLLDLPPAEPLS